MGSDVRDRAAAAFDDPQLVQLRGEVKLVSRSFVQVLLPDPWAATSIPVRELPLQRGDGVELSGVADERFDVIGPAADSGEPQTRKGFRALAVRYDHDGAQHAALVQWPSEAPAHPDPPESPAPADADELDWSDL